MSTLVAFLIGCALTAAVIQVGHQQEHLRATHATHATHATPGICRLT